jgi:hypothetical protein
MHVIENETVDTRTRSPRIFAYVYNWLLQVHFLFLCYV